MRAYRRIHCSDLKRDVLVVCRFIVDEGAKLEDTWREMEKLVRYINIYS